MDFNWQEFIKPELLVLVPVLYALGIGLKKSSIKDNLIPAILGLGGVVLSALYLLGTSQFLGAKDVFMVLFLAITQGLLCAAASVFVNQMVKQAKK